LTRLLVPLLASLALAGSPLGGYWKVYCLASESPQAEGPMEGYAQGLLRLERSLHAGDFDLDLAWELRPSFGSPAPGDLDGGLPAPYRAADLDGRLYPGAGDSAGGFTLHQGVDRAEMGLSLGAADLTLGRQAVHWGSGRLIRPTDFAAPLAASALEVEDRPGVDALRVRWALGMMSELDGGVLAGPDADPDSSGAWLRGRTFLRRADVSLMAAAYRGNAMLGLDLNRPMGEAGAWLEASATGLGSLDGAGDGTLWRATAGLDISPASDLYCAAEYSHSSRGISTRAPQRVAESGVYLPGSHYAGCEARWQLSALLTASAAGLARLDGSGGWASARLEYSMAQNVWLQGGFQLSGGGDPLGLEGWPDLAWTSFNAYF